MKILKFLIPVLFLSILIVPAKAQISNENKSDTISVDNVQVYYFHYTRRCATCQAVEDESKAAVEELYGDKVIFDSFDLEEDLGKEVGDKLGVSGQTLLIVSGDTKINITNDGFMLARTNPEKLKEVIKENVDPLL